MKLLLTGYPGFLASEIKTWFEARNWAVDTLSLLPYPADVPKTGIHLVCDLAHEVPALPDITYDLVIHAAGKAHMVPKTKEEIQDFFDVNVRGTENLLNALKMHPPQSIVFISSVTVYGQEKGTMIREDCPLEGKTPFGLSKVQSEKIVLETPFSRNVIRGIVRLPLIAGRNAPGNLGSIIQAIKHGYYFNIAGGKAVRSVILKSDIPPFLLALSKHGGIYNLTDGRGISFQELSCKIRESVKCPVRPGLPYWIAWGLALACEIASRVLSRKMPLDFSRLDKLVSNLTFDNTKATTEIHFSPHPVIDHIDEVL